VNSLPKTVTQQRRSCDLNPGPSAPESSTLTTRLPSHPDYDLDLIKTYIFQRFCSLLKAWESCAKLQKFQEVIRNLLAV